MGQLAVFTIGCYKEVAPMGHIAFYICVCVLQIGSPDGTVSRFTIGCYKEVAPMGHIAILYLCGCYNEVVPMGQLVVLLLAVTNR